MGEKVRVRQFIDVETGEIFYENEIADNYYGTRPFWKMYKQEFTELLKKYDGKQKDVILYIIEHLRQADNTFHGTYKIISKEIHTSEVTVSKAMKKMQDDKFITIETPAVWRVNPNYIMRGNEAKRGFLSKIFFDLWEKRDIIRNGHTNKEGRGESCDRT